MKKKIVLLLCGVTIIATVGLIIWGKKVTKENEIREKYQQAIEDYENSDYGNAYSLLADIPEGYEKRDDIYRELSNYKKTYVSALALLEDEDYDNAAKKLSELPNDYRDKELIISNIDKIEKLVENTWYDDLADYDWYYETTFSLSAYSDELTLYIFEDEYSGNTFMNTYTDRIDIVDLFDDGKAYVESDERDNFNLDINSVESGEYTMFNNYVTSTYRIKESTNSRYVRPDCIVDGCHYKAVTSMVGISGKMEYYCRDHYEQMGEMMSDMMGLD